MRLRIRNAFQPGPLCSSFIAAVPLLSMAVVLVTAIPSAVVALVIGIGAGSFSWLLHASPYGWHSARGTDLVGSERDSVDGESLSETT